jgi:hypothetical protein
MEKQIDFSRFTGVRADSGGRAETEDVARLQNPRQQLRPQSEIERHPTYYQRSQEREGRSEWSGGSMDWLRMPGSLCHWLARHSSGPRKYASFTATAPSALMVSNMAAVAIRACLKLMRRLSCETGGTQIARVLRLALAETETVSGVVFIGDHLRGRSRRAARAGGGARAKVHAAIRVS